MNIQFQSGKIEEATRIVKDSFVPIMNRHKGFKGQFLLTQSTTGKAISINLWNTKTDLTAFEASPLYKQLLGKLAGILAGPPAGKRDDVSFQV